MKMFAVVLFFVSLSAFANNGGVVRFQGKIVESGCNMSVGLNEQFYGCQNEILKKEEEKKENKASSNLENIISTSSFPKNNGETKTFNLEGNNVEITKIYNKKYNKLYWVNIDFQ